MCFSLKKQKNKQALQKVQCSQINVDMYKQIVEKQEYSIKKQLAQATMSRQTQISQVNAQTEDMISRSSFKKTIQKQNSESIESQYVFEKKLGEGAQGLVYEAISKISGKKVAIKIINIEKQDKDLNDEIDNEIEILSVLDHPNIMKILEIQRSSNKVYLVSELYSGKNLKQYTKEQQLQNKQIPEEKLADIIKQILRALNYLKIKGIAHLDIKAENIIFSSETSSQIKIIDFGFASNSKSRQASNNSDKLKGTPYYFAPENLDLNEKNHKESKKDIWAVGVLAYLMATYEMPFNGNNFQELFKSILTKQPQFDHPKLNFYSSEFITFLQGLLKKDSSLRSSPRAALKSQWIKLSVQRSYGISSTLIENLQTFLQYNLEESKITYKIIKFICNNIIDKEKNQSAQKIIKSFNIFDLKNNGIINTQQLIKTIQNLNNKENFMSLFEKQYFLQNELSFSDFLSIFMPLEEVLTEENLKIVFKMLDYNKSKTISFEQIQQSLIPYIRCHKFVKQASDNEMNFDEFVKLFL